MHSDVIFLVIHTASNHDVTQARPGHVGSQTSAKVLHKTSGSSMGDDFVIQRDLSRPVPQGRNVYILEP